MSLIIRVLALSLTVILGLVTFGGGRSEAYYRAGAAGCGPRGCAAARCGPRGCAAVGVGRYGYRRGAVGVRRY
ncbi:hypothetical protein XH92_18570 [Bradyrhizobium sp. CCBAU 53421]|nr:hypothetical protein XH92_18570 [Bradyrhizobium sp. CCBAU 53421]